MMKDRMIQNGIEYERRGEQYYPLLDLGEQTTYEIGKYGKLHLEFKIERLKSILTPTTTLADTYYETLEDINAIKHHYYDYMVTEPINADEGLKRFSSADYDLCCALITMLLREEHFSNGSFGERFENGDVTPIVERMIALLKDSAEE